MATVLQCERTRSELPTGREAAVGRVIATLRAEPGAALALGEMAEIACLSQFHFCRVFHQAVGIPPAAFQAAVRLEQAKRLLFTTGLSVTDICFEVGYESLGTFTTRFTASVGQAPGKLRQACERFDPGDLDWLRDPARNPFGPPPSDTAHLAGVTGHVVGPVGFAGPIFVGLFPQPHARGRPVAGTILLAPGPFQIAPVPDGVYFVLAAAPGWTADALRLLLPNEAVPVGGASIPIPVVGGRGLARPEVRLRPYLPTDPPVLISMPLLVPDRSARAGIKSR